MVCVPGIHRIALVHRVEEIANLRVLPYELPLNVRKPDRSQLDKLDQRADCVVDLLE